MEMVGIGNNRAGTGGNWRELGRELTGRGGNRGGPRPDLEQEVAAIGGIYSKTG